MGSDTDRMVAIKKIPAFLILTWLVLLTRPVPGQVNFSQYFQYDLLPWPDFENYNDIPIDWNFDGKLQSLVNSGITELKDGNHNRALTDLNSAILMKSDFWVSYYYRGIVYQQTGMTKEALSDLTTAYYKSNAAWQVCIELAEVYHHNRRFADAEKLYEEAKSKAPDRVDGYFGVAQMSFLQFQYDKAARWYKKCNDVAPNFPNAYLRLGLLKLFINRRENKALEYFDEALAKDSIYQEGLFWRGLINLEFNNNDVALKDWTRLIRLNPRHPYYTMVRGFLYIELGDFEKAFTDLKNSILAHDVDENKFSFASTIFNQQIDLQAASTHLIRNIFGLDDQVAVPLKTAYCYLLSKKYNDVISWCRTSLAKQQTASGLFLKGLAFEYLQQHDSAYANYDRALKLDNDIFELHKKRAIYRTELKDWKGAILDFSEMERLQPESIVTARLRGTLLFAFKDYNGAILQLTKYLKNDSANTEIINMRAFSHLKMGNISLSMADYERLRRINPKDINAWAQIYVCKIAMKDTTNALQFLTVFQQEFPYHIFPRIQRMEIHLARKQWDHALKEFETMDISYFSGEQSLSEALYLKGMAFSGKKEYERAIEVFTEAIKKGQALNFTNLDAYFQRGKLYYESGHRKKAIADFKKLRASGYSENTAFIDSVLKDE